ncbi:carboxypeptidase-like regulatory domain-containing protein [Flavobacterium eburneipallidum]|uniref:carboxypeptidase-like regulatory domain-containing protein n=1 Tax=Flavobacterium eburneipallidum TaxID=3003263 RepID=UPI0024824B09|nr:carboxypeptidase-like regulatory domain-containing protein [Flavobacterium eburneipallidum]
MNNNSLFKPWVVQVLPKFYCLLFLFYLTEGYAQDKTITGIVTDINGALPNVTVTVKNTGITTFSDLNGIYFIIASPTDVLLFSYIGYKTTEITINNRQTINLLMQEDTSMLQEVTINAGYYSVKDSERTGTGI